MKIFKKAISLVLVFAMLAGFAGMTGYKYSPMSITAEALGTQLYYDVPATTSKPIDSLAAQKSLTKFDVPTLLYCNSSGTIVSSYDGMTFDTGIDITFPSGTTKATFKVVSLGDDTGGSVFSANGDNTVYYSATKTDFSSNSWTINLAGLTKSQHMDPDPSVTWMIFRLDYDCNVSHADESGNKYSDKTSVTYTQYAAAYVQELRYKAGLNVQAEFINNGGGSEAIISLYERMNFANFINNTKGIQVIPTIKNNAKLTYGFLDSITFGTGVNNDSSHNTSINSDSDGVFRHLTLRRNSGSYTDYMYYGVGDYTGTGTYLAENASEALYKDGTTSNYTFGGKIYFDTSIASTQKISFPILFDFNRYEWASGSTGDNDLNGSNTRLYDVGQEQPYEYSPTFENKWQDGYWRQHNVSAAPYSDDTIHKNSPMSGSNFTTSLYDSGLVITGSLPGNTGDSHYSDYTHTATVDFSKFSSAKYARYGLHVWSDEKRGDWSRRSQVALTEMMHIDIIPVNTTTNRNIINAAISNNYIQAEMDENWWNRYRNDVVFSYFSNGDLSDMYGLTALRDETEVNNPIYAGINYTPLYTELVTNSSEIYYERGHVYTSDTLGGIVQAGQKFKNVVDVSVVDPSQKSYYSSSDDGNGLDNLTNASLYRYSGAYFYQPTIWEEYATMRISAYKLLNYPGSVRNILSGFSYDHSQSDFTNNKTYDHPDFGKLGSGLACYKQAEFDAMLSSIDSLKQKLDNGSNWATLADIKLRNDSSSIDLNGDGTIDITGGGAWVTGSDGKVIKGYTAIIEHLRSLIPTEKITYWSGVTEDGELKSSEILKYDTTDLNKILNNIISSYNAGMYVYQNGIAFEAAVKSFFDELSNTLTNKKSKTEFTGWNAIFTQLTNMAGGEEINTGNIQKKFDSIYTDDANKTTSNAIKAVVDDYEKFTQTDSTYASDPTKVEGSTRNNQDELDSYVERLHSILMGKLPATAVVEKANEVKAWPEQQKFTVYNYNLENTPSKSEQLVKYTEGSIQDLKDEADRIASQKYTMLTTELATITAAVTAVENLKNLTTDSTPGKLVYTLAVATYIDKAMNNAKIALYGEDGTDLLSKEVVSPDGTKTHEQPLYTAQSIKELQVVLEEAAAVRAKITSGEYTWQDQLEVDKLTFALYEETSDDTKFLLFSHPIAYRTWIWNEDGSYGGYTDNWTDDEEHWNNFLNGGTRFQNIMGADKYGLQPGPAYYGFLEDEIKGNTIKKFDENGNVISEDKSYIGTVWYADGKLVYSEGSSTPAGDRVFKNWSSYMDAYDAAVALFNAQDKTIDKQDEINAAANLLYEKRNALELMSLYFPNNTQDYETAKGWYNELAAYVQKTDVTRYGWEYVDVTEEVTDETTGEVTTVTTTVFQKSENPLSSVEQSVYIYNGITPEIEADIAKFKAKYASDSSTEDYNSLEAARALYNSINAALTDPATGMLYTVKKTNDESLIAGMKDLTENYIAGKWTVTFDEETGASSGVYTTGLLNSTQAGLLQTYLTNAQNRINAKTDATAGFGGQLAGFTTTIFEEVQKPATDLQFANAMRKQVEGFMDMKFNIELPSFYNGGNTITAPVFDQKVVADYKNDIKTFYEQTYEWPAIYQIHGLEVQKSTASNTKDNYFVVQYPNSGEHYATNTLKNGTTNVNNATTSYNNLKPKNDDAVDNKIYELFTELGGKSHYYTEILEYVNSYHTASLAWIVNNALGKKLFIDDVETEVILADLNSTANGSDGSKIAVEDAQLTAINNANVPFGQQETVMIDVNYDVRKITSTESWYTEGYGETDNGRVYYNYDWFIDTKTLESSLTTAQTQIKNQLKITDFNETTQLIVPSAPAAQVTQIKNQCWTSTRESNLSTTITSAQTNYIKKPAQNIYDAIRGLDLKYATDAYRDVYNTYLGIMGQHIADGNWLEGSFSHAILDGDNKELISDVDFKFYNVSQVSRLPDDMYNLPEGAVPPYGIVSRSQFGSFLTQYTQADEYADQTDNPWYKMEQYINDFIDNGATVTIDQAAKVNSYNVGTTDDDNYESIMETLIDEYLSQLEFDDLVFDNLDAVVAAFLGDNLSAGLAAVKTTLEGKGFIVSSSYGNFYKLSNYTDESLLQVAGILRSNNVLKDGVIIEKIINTEEYKWIGETFPLPITYGVDYKGSFYTSTTDQNKIDSSNKDHNSMLLAFLTALNTQLELKPVKIAKENNNDQKDYLTEALSAAAFAKENEAKYDTNHTSWKTFETEYTNAQALLDNVDNYNITHQELFDNQTSALLKAIENLKDALLADNYAPSMTLKTSVGGVKDFYSKAAYEVALQKADSASYTETKDENGKVTYTPNPATGTFFVPNSSGYSLIVYTNELNPRIVINLEDLEQMLADGTDGGAVVMQDAAKKEFISINAVRTSGVVTNVIAGTIVPAQKENPETMSVLATAQATSNSAVTVENASTVKGSSAFAILAPTFVKDTATQAALYTIEARDGSVRSTETGTVNGNNADQFDFGGAGQEPVDIAKDNNGKIAIYIYYYSLKAADGTDEGINADGSALATPAINGTHVPSALLSGEPGFKGADWRNGILLQRHFSDSHRVWEYVSEVKKNKNNQYSVNGTIGVPVYNDPNFGYLNTGSFYYVLDRNADADTVDGKVIAEYNSGNNSVAGCMDYDRATAAKTAMIKAINAMTETEFAVMKKSGRFYNYGDYETDEFGNVLYNGDEPKWINWAQSLNNKVENGDLVFVHVVDRWGNVVNRIVEITNLDEYAPSVNSAASGAVTIMEDGGSGIADIQVHNGDFSLGEFEYQISQSQNVKLENGQITNKAEVKCASNVLTIINLVPGKTYYIGAEDKAGNRGTTAVKADANGHIAITIENEFVQTGEDMGFEGTSTFTLNGTDTIILNSGDVSSVINADIGGNVFANRTIRHYITTTDSVTALKTVYQDGTVEEYTAENATVKNNGDGTLTWTIKRKLTEGEHTYKVYAKTNGAYETFYALAVINATTRTVKVECTNVGQGATVLTFSGSLSFDIANYVSKEVPYGAKVTISATAYTTYEGCEFYYWINNTTDRIINTSDVYEFKAVANADYIAQFTNNSTCIDGKKFVIYVNNAKNVIERFELADGENYTVPTGPVLPDYTFKGWSMTKAEVLASDKNTIIVEPIYELNVTNTVTITEGNYTATGAGTYTAEDNERAVVTISTSEKNDDGQEFLYWIDADTNEKVSYSRTYTFFCVKDTELTPVYGDASSVKAEPIVRITEVKFNALSGKVSFFAERSVPEDFVILQTGIVVTKTEAIGTNEDVFVVGGASTAAGTSTSTANNGFYSANTAVATGQTVWARAYVIYETADGEIFEAYGPVVSYTVD